MAKSNSRKPAPAKDPVKVTQEAAASAKAAAAPTAEGAKAPGADTKTTNAPPATQEPAAGTGTAPEQALGNGNPPATEGANGEGAAGNFIKPDAEGSAPSQIGGNGTLGEGEGTGAAPTAEALAAGTAVPGTEGAENAAAETQVNDLKDERYVAAFNKYAELYNEMPDNSLRVDQIEGFNAEKQAELDAETNKGAAATAGTAEEEFDHEHFVMAEKVDADGNLQKKKFNRVTWDLLKNSPDGWKEIAPTPPEVKALQS